jgi:hypothetical protein
MRFACPCCGFLTRSEEPAGTFEICPVCCWEDDNVPHDDPDFAGGANHVSLNQARKNFASFGAVEIGMKPFTRAPKPDELPVVR